MTEYQKSLVVEHKELVARINEFVPQVKEDKCEDGEELVRRALQLNAMFNYEGALKERLYNAGIALQGCQYNPTYFAKVDDKQLSTPVEDIPTTEGKPGSDFDKDSNNE